MVKNTRIKTSTIVESQLPQFVRDDFPLVSEFLEQYYRSQEFQGGTLDILNNIDQYVKVDELTDLTESTTLSQDITIFSETIPVTSTKGFPESYGLVQIDSEIITYTGITTNTFTGCVRGFSGISSYRSKNKPDELVFSQTNAEEHKNGASVKNLNILFLKEFFTKTKKQILPGFESREFYPGINQKLFVKQAKDFYKSKGTDESFKILFKALYGKKVDVIKPRDFLIEPSDAQYRVTRDLIVEAISGDPLKLKNRTLFQDQTNFLNPARGSVTNVEKVTRNAKTYYLLSLDYDFNKDIDVSGSIYGKFAVHPKTRLIGNAPAGSTVLDVDSTIGFPESGELVTTDANGLLAIISYKSKTINQFFGCSASNGAATPQLKSLSELRLNAYAYGYTGIGTAEVAKIRISGVLSDLNILDNTYGYEKFDEIKIKSLGSQLTDVRSNNWKFNIASKYQVDSITLVDVSDYTYRLKTKEANSLNLGDKLKLVDSASEEKTTVVIAIENGNTLLIRGQGSLNLSRTYTIERILSKVDAINYPNANVYTSDVQNVYTDLKNSTYIASPSLPSYYETRLNIKDRSISILRSENSEVVTNGNHEFLTGDAIYYSTSSNTDTLGISTGVYYVKKISDSRVKLYRSKANISNDTFISIGSTSVTTANKFVLFDFSNQTLEPQKLLRKISDPENDGDVHVTSPGHIGILANGVEILNYKSKDSVFYGPIEEIVVTSGGDDYDVINPPNLVISDSIGFGATAFCEVEGSLKTINLIDGGFDYINEPVVNITGGNGKGAVAKVETITVEHEAKFDAALGINISNDTIGFSSYHKFRDGEEIVYKADGQNGIGGISTDSKYNVSILDPLTVKIHRTFEDAISGINTINLTYSGKGIQRFVATNRKKVISGIKVVSGGSGYTNRKVVLSSNDVNLATNSVYAKNHKYNDGEIVVYTTNGTSIGGLTNNQPYYVSKVDDDNFKLSLVGTGTTNTDFYYQTKQYLNLTSSGVGDHVFNYQPITVEVSGVIGVSSISGQNFGAVVQPIFRGKVESVFVQNGGKNYGSEQILNYNRQPLFTLNSGSGAEVLPIVFGGRIVDVVIKSSGSGYNSPPSLTVTGEGTGAELTPIVTNGAITSVKVTNSGFGYSQKSTNILVSAAGSQAKFQAQIKAWNINLFERLLQSNSISADDGVIDKGFNDNYGLQYTHVYSPRKLRQSLFSKRIIDNNVVYDPDLIIDRNNGQELRSTSHSPIIGWAYDGNPIYGPYGYSTKTGGSVREMVSGYVLKNNPNRPNLSLYPQGFFVEDYEFNNTGDLDEYNGRFCVTPEFPKGTYAYFTTISNGSPETDGAFRNYKKPQFPYFIGNKFKSKPIEFNYKKESNQDDFNINKSGWSRNITPYNLNSETTDYDYLLDPNQITEQNSEVISTYTGSLDKIDIISGGSNYKVKDQLIFDNEGTEGGGASAEVSYVGGKVVNTISVASTSVTSIEFIQSNQSGVFIGLSDVPHNLSNNDEVTVSGLSTTGTNFQRFFRIKVPTNQLVLRSSVGSAAATGIVTFFDVSGNLSYPNVKENDVFTIENEKVKILYVDQISNRIKVQRSHEGTVGLSHTASTAIVENPSKFLIDVGFVDLFNFKENRQFYFNPKESLALGTVSGIGSTTILSNPGVGINQVFIPTKAIYLPNHSLETGTELIYSHGGGTPITVSAVSVGSTFQLSDGQIVYAAKINNDFIGIATNKVGLGTNGNFVGIGETNLYGTLYFTNFGTGVNHSFKTNYINTLSGKVDKNVVTVSTASTHGLSVNDLVKVNVQSGISTSILLKYNRPNRRVVANPVIFQQSNIDAVNNIITKENHGFYTGQKLIFESLIRQEDSIISTTVFINESTIYPSPAIIETSGSLIIQDSGTVTIDTDILENNGIYYAVVLDYNRFKLSDSFYNSKLKNPITLRITENSYGTVAAVNPPIALIKNQTLEFNLSDDSLSYRRGTQRYSAYDLNFYLDSNFKNKFDATLTNSTFEISRSGMVGVDTTAKVSIKCNDSVPKNLYYKLDLVDIQNLPTINKEIIIDKENIINSNSLLVLDSGYSGSYRVSGITSTSFNYNLLVRPEKDNYTSSEGSLSYTTNSKNVFGKISNIEIKSKGRNYKKLPQVIDVVSSYGTGAILEPFSSGIGSIKSIRIKDIGFDYPSDTTLRPTAKIPEILKLEPLASFEKIGISSAGIGYALAPNLVVIDGFTNKVVNDVSLKYNLGDPTVTILKNTTGLYNATPRIVPVNNSNGVGIKSMFYNSTSKDVTVVLNVGYSTASAFPFNVGDKILIENVSIGINSTGNGYNSEDYNYQLFSVKSVDPNIGGVNGSIVYSLTNYLAFGENPGQFDPINSSGVVVPEKYFPLFTSTLKKNQFIPGEKIRSTTSSYFNGNVVSVNSNSDYLKVSTNTGFASNDIIRGETSDSYATIKSIKSFNSIYNVDSSSIVKKGWNQETGFLNNEQQRLHDNDYYQYFSYALKSEIPYDKWNNPVSNLDHTAGFKKFSDLIIETRDENSVGIETSQDGGDVTGIADLSGVIDLHCYNDFDLAKENNLFIGNKVYSDEIILKSKNIQDYLESVGNRVLTIDDFSNEFNNLPRTTKYTVVDTFKLSDYRTKKYVIFIRDRRFTEDKETIIVTLLHDNSYGYINQYGRVESVADMGYFDFAIEEGNGKLLFYPNKFRVNDFDISFVAYSIEDSIAGIGNTALGNVVDIKTSNVGVSTGSTTAIVGIASTYRASKVLVQLNTTDGRYEFDELTVIHDGTDVELLEYGQLTNHSLDAASSFGLGSYSTRLSGSNLFIDFTPIAGVAVTANTLCVSIASTAATGVGTATLNTTLLDSSLTTISSSSSPVQNKIAQYSKDTYNGGYYLVSIEDTTNGAHQVSELMTVNNETEVYVTEFGNLETAYTLGEFEASISGSNVEIYFTPNPDANFEIRVFQNVLRVVDPLSSRNIIDLTNASINSGSGVYFGTEKDVKRSFELKHKQKPIFKREFNGGDSGIVGIASSKIRIPEHFFVTGEEVTYSHFDKIVQSSPIGIVTTNISGIGLTDKLPSKLYIVKVDDLYVQVASSVENALKTSPEILTFTNVGVGSVHAFTSKKQNSRALITIDNVIQTPIVPTNITTRLASSVLTTEDRVSFTGITSFFSGDLFKVNDEIMRVATTGVGTINTLIVERAWMGTGLSTHSANSLVTKLTGNYNIVDNTINFVDAPYGNYPIGSVTNPPDYRDFSGITTHSTFSGRVFMRSATQNTSIEPYTYNYIFDDVSTGFNGITTSFTLKSENQNITNVSQSNAIILVNNIFQGPNRGGSTRVFGDYELKEGSGITTAVFSGVDYGVTYDNNTNRIPRGGIIVSIGSTRGLGYQPLVAAGGTAIISPSGTISSVAIGNSGSGYRTGIQTSVYVRAYTSSGIGITIGTATIVNGKATSVSITNPGSGYTTTNPPTIIFDSPLSYSNIPLIYSSTSGVGTGAVVDVIVGQGSSIVDFVIKNYGFNYKQDEILTIPTTGNIGIPLESSKPFEPFQVRVEKTYNDSFAGWSIGDLQVLDPIDNLFDGVRTSFPLTINGQQISIRSKPGSKIDIESTLLVFINDILQVPGKGYSFEGGSRIVFSEPPKGADSNYPSQGYSSKVLFYRGTANIDVVDVDILETIKIGDTVTLNDDNPLYDQEERLVTEITATDTLLTNTYPGPGISRNLSYERPLEWCKQTEDRFVNGNQVPKDRIEYESLINPTTNIIQNVGVGSTVVYVESVRTFFDNVKENASTKQKYEIEIFSQDGDVVTREKINSSSYTGDFGKIVGVAITSTVGIATTGVFGLVFNVDIPSDSFLRDPSIVGSAITVTGLAVGDYFTLSNSNIGYGITSLRSDGSVIGIGSQFLDNVYQVTNIDYNPKGTIVSSDLTITDTEIFDSPTVVEGESEKFVISDTTVIVDTTFDSPTIVADGITLTVASPVTLTISDIIIVTLTVAEMGTLIIGETERTRVTVRVAGYNGLESNLPSKSRKGPGYYYGDFSWGKISIPTRTSPKTFTSYVSNGYSGISSSPVVRRINPLKYLNYI